VSGAPAVAAPPGPHPAAGLSSVPHVYAHFPFCARKCPYCDFNSHAGREAETEAYVAALLREAEALGAGTNPRTLFVGGGTPTHAPPAVLARYLGGLRALLGDARLEEFTVEANPGSLTEAKVAALVDAGVDRVSLGAQSFDDRHLATLGRIHGADDTVRGVEALRAGGVRRLSVDLILAIPGQTLDEQARDADRAVALDPEHVSAYVLTFEEGTAFTRWMREGRLPAPDDDRDLAHQHLACERFAAAGYRRYEVSNHARPGAECRHNLGYWRDAEWLALGAGAHGHVGRRRWKNVSDPALYARRVAEGGSAVDWVEAATPEVALFEAMMMGLRLVEGVDLEDLAVRTGIDARERFAAEIARHERDGLLRVEGPRLAPTARGLDLASFVARSFLPDEAG
jgi:oxygen-independent coproporphyrinogen-3 oxidase